MQIVFISPVESTTHSDYNVSLAAEPCLEDTAFEVEAHDDSILEMTNQCFAVVFQFN